MAKSVLCAALVVAAAALGGCSSITVSTDYDPAADFTKYKSYSWMPTDSVRNPLVRSRIENAVDKQLAAKGLVKKADGADLMVAVHPRLSKDVQMNTYNSGWGYGRGWYGGGMGMSTTTVSEIPVGTLIVDLVDASKKDLVWRGTASSQLDSEASAEKKTELIDEAMAKLFAGYPPTKK